MTNLETGEPPEVVIANQSAEHDRVVKAMSDAAKSLEEAKSIPIFNRLSIWDSLTVSLVRNLTVELFLSRPLGFAAEYHTIHADMPELTPGAIVAKAIRDFVEELDLEQCRNFIASYHEEPAERALTGDTSTPSSEPSTAP
jgi:hypothetical protein